MHQNRIFHKMFHVCGRIIAGLLIAIVIGLLFGLVVQYLWNALMPDLFALPRIDFWQAFMMIVLSRLLFGGMGGHHKKKVYMNGHSDHGHHGRKLWDHYRCKHRPWSRWEHHRHDREDDESKLFNDYWTQRGEKDFEAFREARKNEKSTEDEKP